MPQEPPRILCNVESVGSGGNDVVMVFDGGAMAFAGEHNPHCTVRRFTSNIPMRAETLKRMKCRKAARKSPPPLASEKEGFATQQQLSLMFSVERGGAEKEV